MSPSEARVLWKKGPKFGSAASQWVSARNGGTHRESRVPRTCWVYGGRQRPLLLAVALY